MEARRVVVAAAAEGSQANNIGQKSHDAGFFRIHKGVICHHEVLQGTTVNADRHVEPSTDWELTSVANGTTSPENGHCTMTMHTATRVLGFLAKIKITFMTRPPYSPDLGRPVTFGYSRSSMNTSEVQYSRRINSRAGVLQNAWRKCVLFVLQKADFETGPLHWSGREVLQKRMTCIFFSINFIIFNEFNLSIYWAPFAKSFSVKALRAYATDRYGSIISRVR